MAVALLALTACDKATTPALPAAAADSSRRHHIRPGSCSRPCAGDEDPRVSALLQQHGAVAPESDCIPTIQLFGLPFEWRRRHGPSLMDDEWIYGAAWSRSIRPWWRAARTGCPPGRQDAGQQLWQISAYVRSMSLPATIAAERESTPSQNPAPVPPEVGQNPGWSPAPSTTNSFTTLTQGPG